MNRGFSLVEVVCALGIIAVGLVGLLALFPIGIQSSARAGDHTSAAILGEYVVNQVRLRHDAISLNDTTPQALEALGWADYDYHDKTYSFDADSPHHFGSGEQIVRQCRFPDNFYDPANPDDPNNGLSDQHLYSRYEVTLKFDAVPGWLGPQGEAYLMRVVVTIRWPRVLGIEARAKQETMTFVAYIRPKL